MGRQIAILLSFEDEQELLGLAHDRDFLLTTGWLRKPGLLSQELRTLPPDEEATEYEYDCFLIPRSLARTRRAGLANPNLERPYRIDTGDIPCIEWMRTIARREPNFRFDSRMRARLYVGTHWDYGSDARWMNEVVELYDLLVKRIKTLTVRVQDVWPRYVSRRFSPEFFDVPGLARSGNVWTMEEPSTNLPDVRDLSSR